MCRTFQMRRFLALSIAILWAVVKWEDKALQNTGRVLEALSYQETDTESMDAPIRRLASSWDIKGKGSLLDSLSQFFSGSFSHRLIKEKWGIYGVYITYLLHIYIYIIYKLYVYVNIHYKILYT